MDVVTVHAKPPQRLLRKRKRLLDNVLFSRRAIGQTEPPERDDLPADESNDSGGRSAKRRKLKTEGNAVDSLPWKTLTRPKSSGFDADVALMSLEEVDDVDIVYLDETKKRVSYNLLDKNKTRGQASRISAVEQSSTVTTVPADPPGFHNFNAKKLLPEWETLQLKGCLNRAIHKLGFQSPTEIQKQALPSVFAGRDVIGVAETGSGKTLAFGLPILNHILANPPQPTPRPLVALILTPTRELAIQVADHLNAVASNLYPKNHEKQQAKLKPGQPKPPPRISVGAIVGGIDNHKQMRVIKRGMDIMVATPGRLWDLIGEGGVIFQIDEDLTQSIRKIRFLVLDEADRMIETGHFKELEQIVRLTFREREGDRTTDPEFPSEAAETSAGSDALQTLVFSATLSKDLQQNLKKRKQRHSKGKGAQKASSALDDLLMRLDFRDSEPVVVDLSPDKGVVSTLQESKVECTIQDKDVYLYYFLLRYPGKTLVFMGSIDGIRRLHPIFQHLGIQAFTLHSNMEQKQRLRNLERFRSTVDSVLIATDVAARGLDIPSVDHVIHYQVPRSADSVLAELEHREAEDDIPDLQFDLDIIDRLKHRVSLARRIDAVVHKHTKADHEKNWLKQAAKDLDVEIDPDFVHIDDDDGDDRAYRRKKQEKEGAAALKRELEFLLKQPLVANGVRAKYITSGTRSIVDNLISGKGHEKIVGVNKAAAIEAVAKP
ncbi:ATP-dependent RNA helicase [Tulasnella sp. UAMH 9824]|nr:ATP-dependent RNA helicase [Tulasnella sp. UAMH 9824]